MEKKDILEKVKDIIAQHLASDDITDDATIKALGGDSLDTMDIFMAIDKDFNVKSSDTEVANVQDLTVKEIADYVYGKLNG